MEYSCDRSDLKSAILHSRVTRDEDGARPMFKKAESCHYLTARAPLAKSRVADVRTAPQPRTELKGLKHHRKVPTPRTIDDWHGKSVPKEGFSLINFCSIVHFLTGFRVDIILQNAMQIESSDDNKPT